MPWMITFFGVLVVPLGVVSIYFIIIQPIVIGTWCALCLLAALAMLIMIPFAVDELVAMGQFMRRSLRVGKPFWRTFLMGGAMPRGSEKDEDLASLANAITDMLRGVTVPWTLASAVVIGIVLMFTRMLFGTTGALANSDHLMGALILTVAVMATAEVFRPLRLVNVAFGSWLVAAPWLLNGGTGTGSWADVAAGLATILLSLPRGTRSAEHYAGWDKYVI